MIDLFYSSSPNVFKVMIALEELALDHRIVFVDLSQGEQHDPEKLGGAISGKVPVIKDHAPSDDGAPLTVFESGAILQYLAEKTGRLLPAAPRERLRAMQWLFWQMGGLGPVGGQFWHFKSFAQRLEPDTDFTYPRRRYTRMLSALWAVMERQLATHEYLAGEYSIADIACFPWIRYLGPDLTDAEFPALARWHAAIAERPAVERAYAARDAVKTDYGLNERGGIAYPWHGLAKNLIVA